MFIYKQIYIQKYLFIIVIMQELSESKNSKRFLL